ncbi:MAG: 30S ribosomal protein S19e [Candidatus Brockarchaeota archaeon]|nr:30S ribosomal protein S19e [Candidatus Brockarchaeota archaeon]
MHVKAVPADILIERIAEYLRENVKEVNPPKWALFVKTGSHRERPPDRLDWWYVRAASILRRLYIKGPTGVSRLRKAYGGRKKYPMRRAHKVRAGGAVIRKILQQLEAAGLVSKSNKGRWLTPKGFSLLDRLSREAVGKG